MFSFSVLLIKDQVCYKKTMGSLVTVASTNAVRLRENRRYERSGYVNKLNVNVLKDILALGIIGRKESVWVNVVCGQVGHGSSAPLPPRVCHLY